MQSATSPLDVLANPTDNVFWENQLQMLDAASEVEGNIKTTGFATYFQTLQRLISHALFKELQISTLLKELL